MLVRGDPNMLEGIALTLCSIDPGGDRASGVRGSSTT
jgi:hypothetical protein